MNKLRKKMTKEAVKITHNDIGKSVTVSASTHIKNIINLNYKPVNAISVGHYYVISKI